MPPIGWLAVLNPAVVSSEKPTLPSSVVQTIGYSIAARLMVR